MASGLEELARKRFGMREEFLEEERDMHKRVFAACPA
jgi:hypothetical protein